MANLVISGDVSGTVTLSAPSTAGTTTLTLPTTTGTVLASNSASTINSGTSSSMTLQTNGTTAMTIDTSQNVGIGTTSPVYKLNVTTASDGVQIFSTNGTIQQAVAYSLSGVSYTGTITNHPSAFLTNNAERMRIDSSGNVLVGVTSASTYAGGGSAFVTSTNGINPLSLVSSAATPYGAFIYYTTSPNGTSQEFIICKDSSANRFVARSNGGLANYSANNVNLSDAREKTNIELAGSYLDKICAIPVKTFNYIDQNMEEDSGLTLGVIAQDVQAVAPELVSESNWAGKDEPEKLRLSIYQTDLQYALMKCIQEQQTIINDLKARIETLETK